jgi:metallo-beta-lactamase class B
MKLITALACSLALLSFQGQAPRTLQPDPPNGCSDCPAWNAHKAPFRVFADTYYVGTAGLSAMLVTSDAGHVLLDGALPQSAALIDANIRALGFRTEDVKLILNSHAHFDHAGGIAALQRVSGATVAASPSGAAALRRGLPTEDDPQIAFGPRFQAFPPVKDVQVVSDGEVLRVGPLAITAHFTPGHTPGSTTWTWKACEPAAPAPRCLDIVYADSLTAASAPSFRFTGDATHPSRVEAFRASIARVAALPCDIVISTHPSFTALDDKLTRRGGLAPGAAGDPFVDSEGCRTYAAGAAKRLEDRVAEEQQKKP